MTTQALLLDFDGTLVDSLPMLYKLYQGFLGLMGKQGSKEEFDELNGVGWSEIIQTLKQRYQLPGSEGDLVKTYYAYLLRAYAKEVDFFPGTRPFLERMHAQGVKLVIVSSAHVTLIESFLQEQEAASLFHAVITPEGLARSKPDPAIYQRALEHLNLHSDQAVAVEDSTHGLNAAHGAGIQAVALIRKDISPPKGDYPIISEWSQLESFISV